jgi:hypothetical protein
MFLCRRIKQRSIQMSANILNYSRDLRLKISAHEYRLAGTFEPLLYLGIGAAAFVFMASIVMDLARAIWS